MKGLIIKDYRIILSQKRFLILYTLVAVVLSFSMDQTFIVGYMPMVGMLLLLSTISYDHHDNGFSFLMTMPVKPGDYAVAKYIFTIAGMLIIWIFSIAFQLLSMAVQNRMDMLDLPDLVMSDLMILPIFLLILSLMVPVDIKYSPEKGRIVVFILFGAFMVLILAGKGLAELLADKVNFDAQKVFGMINSTGAVIAVFVASIVALAISLMVSIRIMQNKEF